MSEKSRFLQMIPVLPSADIKRDVAWYAQHTGFEWSFGDDMYCGLVRDGLEIHLQWHADNEDDPLLGGSVIKLFVNRIEPYFEEFIERGTVQADGLRKNTPWGTHEFGFFDPNKNAVFLVQDV